MSLNVKDSRAFRLQNVIEKKPEKVVELSKKGEFVAKSKDGSKSFRLLSDVPIRNKTNDHVSLSPKAEAITKTITEISKNLRDASADLLVKEGYDLAPAQDQEWEIGVQRDKLKETVMQRTGVLLFAGKTSAEKSGFAPVTVGAVINAIDVTNDHLNKSYASLLNYIHPSPRDEPQITTATKSQTPRYRGPISNNADESSDLSEAEHAKEKRAKPTSRHENATTESGNAPVEGRETHDRLRRRRSSRSFEEITMRKYRSTRSTKHKSQGAHHRRHPAEEKLERLFSAGSLTPATGKEAPNNASPSMELPSPGPGMPGKDLRRTQESRKNADQGDHTHHSKPKSDEELKTPRSERLKRKRENDDVGKKEVG
jgi:hypothetical protein